jgi:hypothetical protein
MTPPHDAIAQATKHGGMGGLLYLVAGEVGMRAADSKVIWLSRPRGIRWRDFMPALVDSANCAVTVWRRQMVLGPSPEFAVIGALSLALIVPQGWSALEVERRWVR